MVMADTILTYPQYVDITTNNMYGAISFYNFLKGLVNNWLLSELCLDKGH